MTFDDDERKPATMDTVRPASRDIAWGRALLAGAIVGGIGWGTFAAATVGAPGDQAHLEAIIGPRMLVAAVVSAVCLIIAAALVALGRSAITARSRGLFEAAAALVIAVASGWIVVGLGVVQSFVFGAWR
jgi:hypothetical protein